MNCAHCGAPQTFIHICTMACLDWMINLDQQYQPRNFLDVSRCYDYALALQVEPTKPGLHVQPLGTYV